MDTVYGHVSSSSSGSLTSPISTRVITANKDERKKMICSLIEIILPLLGYFSAYSADYKIYRRGNRLIISYGTKISGWNVD